MLLRRIFSRILMCALALVLVVPGGWAASSNFVSGDITEAGWATPHNREVVVSHLNGDMTAFQSGIQTNALVDDFVPIEAKVGLAFMNGLSVVARVLDSSLVRFVIIFILVMFAYWIALEAYNMMTTGGDARKTVENIFKKAGIIAIWLFVLDMGAGRLFMYVAGPIVTIGTYFSDLILGSVTALINADLPDTCAAIHAYTAAHASPDLLMDAQTAADLMCVPTRLSGFFYTAVAAGFKWMLAGIGTNVFTFVIGAVFVVLFIYNAFKFALSALGVIADLSLAVMLLPFTAVNETIGKSSYKGVVGDLFNGFLELFHAESLSIQISRFINAAVYFVSLSVVVGVCAALMAGVVNMDMFALVPGLSSEGFWPSLLIGILVAYLANKATDIAKEMGGKIDDQIGRQFGRDAAAVVGGAAKTAKNWWVAWRKDKKAK